MTSSARTRLAPTYDHWLQALAAGPHPSVVIVIASESGDLLDEIARQLPETNVLALAPSAADAMRLVARQDVATRIDEGRLRVLKGPDYAGATDAWRLFTNVTGMPPMYLDPALQAARPDDLERAKIAAAKVVLGAKENETARRRFAGPYLLNTLTNLPVIATEGDTSSIVGRFAGVPALVVAAGPSLDRTIDRLPEIANRALIIAVDTAVRPLLAAGVRPHVIVSVDPSDVNARHLNDLPDTRGMWLAAEGSLHPTVFPQFAGRTFTFKVSDHEPWPWIAEATARNGQLQAWGSVLTTAFDLACVAGCNPIVFVGADLAYTDDQLYCRNTIYEPDWCHLTTTRARAEFFELAYFATHATSVESDVNGAPVRSAPRFVQFRDWLVARAGAASDREVVNATGGGILQGSPIVQRDLASVIGRLPAVPRGSAFAESLTCAWMQAANDADATERLRRGLHELLDPRGQPHIDRWIEFSAGSISRAQIDERIGFALRSLAETGSGWTTRRTGELSALMTRLCEPDIRLKQIQILERERDEARGGRDAVLKERDVAIHEGTATPGGAADAAAFLGHYPTWRTNRLRYLMDIWSGYGFRQATLLELGCGHGDIGAFFLSLGADVTFCDAREEHLDVVRTRYPGARTVVHDSNRPLALSGPNRYDYVVHMGLLYHLHPGAVAASIANVCRLGRHIVLETEVCDSPDPDLIVETREAGFDQAFDGVGARPSSAFIERVLDRCGVGWQRHDDARLNTDFHVYDWAPQHDGRYFDPDAARRDPLALQQALRRFYTIEVP